MTRTLKVFPLLYSEFFTDKAIFGNQYFFKILFEIESFVFEQSGYH